MESAAAAAAVAIGAQQVLYPEKVEDAIVDTKEDKPLQDCRCTFVVDYGQELSVYNSHQTGVTYFIVICWAFTIWVWLIMLMTEEMGRWRNECTRMFTMKWWGRRRQTTYSAGSGLNIIFDNCLRQNKNNMRLKLMVWLKAAGYFRKVTFTFLVVAHAKMLLTTFWTRWNTSIRRKVSLQWMSWLMLWASPTLALSIQQRPKNFGIGIGYSPIRTGIFWGKFRWTTSSPAVAMTR